MQLAGGPLNCRHLDTAGRQRVGASPRRTIPPVARRAICFGARMPEDRADSCSEKEGTDSRRKRGPVPGRTCCRVARASFSGHRLHSLRELLQDHGSRQHDEDIARIAENLNIGKVEFIERYLEAKQENGLSRVRQKPCPFLSDDDRCTIYSVRPAVCREYPHTDKEDFTFRTMVSPTTR